MKKRVLFAALVLWGAMLSSCSNEDNPNDSGNNNPKEEAYLSLSVRVSQNVESRAVTPNPGEEGDGQENGTAEENKIEKLLVVGFAADGSMGFNEVVESANFSPNGATNSSYSTKQPIRVSTGEFRVYVIANPSEGIVQDAATQPVESVFKEKTFNKGAFTGSTTFPMSSADEITTLSITASNTKSNPALFVTNVQRMLAKVQLKGFAAEGGFTNFGTNGGNSKAQFAAKFEFKKYGIINRRNSAYLFRRVGTTIADGVIGVKENTLNYVIDPKFDQKSGTYNAGFAEQNYWARETNSVSASYWKDIEMRNITDDFCFENTMSKDAQIQGYTTGLVLAAQFTPKAWKGDQNYTEGNTFYKFNNEYYAQLEKVKEDCPAVASFENIDETSYNDNETGRRELIEKYSKFGVTVYYKGMCYYHYWIRHANNGNSSLMGIMEFAIVRNNIYRMTVNSITDPGSPVPPVNPENPDEEKDTYLNITVNVLPWVIRENNMDL